jgi:hypothetical protein
MVPYTMSGEQKTRIKIPSAMLKGFMPLDLSSQAVQPSKRNVHTSGRIYNPALPSLE